MYLSSNMVGVVGILLKLNISHTPIGEARKFCAGVGLLPGLVALVLGDAGMDVWIRCGPLSLPRA